VQSRAAYTVFFRKVGVGSRNVLHLSLGCSLQAPSHPSPCCERERVHTLPSPQKDPIFFSPNSTSVSNSSIPRAPAPESSDPASQAPIPCGSRVPTLDSRGEEIHPHQARVPLLLVRNPSLFGCGLLVFCCKNHFFAGGSPNIRIFLPPRSIQFVVEY